MAKFIIDGTMLETLRLILPTVIPLTVERELVLCQDCIHCITIPQFPDHPYWRQGCLAKQCNQIFSVLMEKGEQNE